MSVLSMFKNNNKILQIIKRAFYRFDDIYCVGVLLFFPIVRACAVP